MQPHVKSGIIFVAACIAAGGALALGTHFGSRSSNDASPTEELGSNATVGTEDASDGYIEQTEIGGDAPVSPLPINPTTDESPPMDRAPLAFAQCRACHSTEAGKTLIGPSLANVYGTQAGQTPGYNFSLAMKASDLVWDDATLDAFLENPQEEVPGTTMTFFGLKNAAQREDVIAYIKTLQ